MKIVYLLFYFECTLLLSFSNANAQEKSPADSLPKAIVNASDNTKKVIIEDQVFERTETPPSMDANSWQKHLDTTLGAYTQAAKRNGIKAGQYQVYVRFLVEKNGSLSDVLVLNDPGFGLGNAALVILKTGPKWSSAKQNGKVVRSFHMIPITFQVGK